MDIVPLGGAAAVDPAAKGDCAWLRRGARRGGVGRGSHRTAGAIVNRNELRDYTVIRFFSESLEPRAEGRHGASTVNPRELRI